VAVLAALVAGLVAAAAVHIQKHRQQMVFFLLRPIKLFFLA